MNNAIKVLQIELGTMANFSYVVGDTASGASVLIDPGDDTESIESSAIKSGLNITAVLLTHGHFDHTGGLNHFSRKLGLPVYLSKDEFELFVPPCKTLKPLVDKEKICVGSLTITCLHTPGHTPGCMCFHVGNNLFTGDTLFVSAIGRTDLPGGSASILFKSLQKIKELPDSTIVWPGHNYGNTTHKKLQALKCENPFLLCQTTTEFLGMTG